MASKIRKIAILLACALCLFAVLPVYALLQPEPDGLFLSAETEPTEYYTLVADGYTMKVNKSNLSLEITDGAYTYQNAKREENDGLSSVWEAKKTDAITVGYRSATTGTQTEKGFTDLNSQVTFTEKVDGFNARIRLNQIGVIFRIDVTLRGGVLDITIPFSSVTENKTDKYKLMYLSVYPFFDSSFGLADGQIFVPDGSGALINLAQETSAKQRFCERVYGEDLGISTFSPVATSPYTVQMPVYATMYSGGGTLSIITGGAEYSEINAYVSGITTNYNFVYTKFIYREEYTKYFQSTGSAGKSQVSCQENLNQFDAGLRIYLNRGSKTVGDLASIYRNYLQEKNYLGNTDDSISPQLRLQFLMAENKETMFGKTTIAMSTADYIASAVEQLSSQVDLSISLLGYTSGGITGSYPNVLPFTNVCGGKSDFKKLIDRAGQLGIPISFACNFSLAYETASGVVKKDKAMSISEQFIAVNDINNRALTVSQKLSALTYQATKDNFTDACDDFVKLNVNAIDLYAMGRYLYSSYYNEVFTRTQLIHKYRELLSQYNLSYNIDSPNDYLWAYCNAYLSTPWSNSGYILETESVPFLQMVLSGYTAMYSKAINLDYCGVDDVLRLIEYNVYPEFLLTEQDAIELYGTASQHIFTSSYDIWKDTAVQTYNTVSSVLSYVVGEMYVNHYMVAENVYLCEYSNGVQIIVNYNQTDYIYGDLTVSAKTAEVIE